MTLTRRSTILEGNFRPTDGLLRKKEPREAAPKLNGMISREVERRTDYRAETRYPAPKTACDVQVAGEGVVMNNISPSGLSVDTQLVAQIGKEVPVSFAGFPSIAGRVVWRRSGAIGIELPDCALDLEELSE